MSARPGPAAHRARTHRPILLLLLPALALGFAGAGRFLRMPPVSSNEDRVAVDAARALVGREIDRRRSRLDLANDREAYASAQRFVRSSLLPPDTAAVFPTAPDGSDGIRAIQVIRLQPHRYRIRATVQWRDMQSRLQHRRFETDLQHGPADDNWYLVDTEFLDSPR